MAGRHAPAPRGRRHRGLRMIFRILGVLALWWAAAPSFAADLVTLGALDGVVSGFEQGHAVIRVVARAAKLRLQIPDADLQRSLFNAQPGDAIAFVVDNAAKPKVITAVTSLARPVTVTAAFWAMVGSAVLVIGVSLLFLGGKNPLIGLDGRYSNSQTQLGLWFVAVATVYVAASFMRGIELGGDFIGGVGLTAHVIAVTGLSAFTFGAAKVVASQKADGQLPVASAQAASPAKVIADKPRLRDLVNDDEANADLGDLQMILITLAAVIIFICQSFWWLTALQIAQQVTLPDVDTTLLATFGIGQGAYLFKKAATPAG